MNMGNAMVGGGRCCEGCVRTIAAESTVFVLLNIAVPLVKLRPWRPSTGGDCKTPRLFPTVDGQRVISDSVFMPGRSTEERDYSRYSDLHEQRPTDSIIYNFRAFTKRSAINSRAISYSLLSSAESTER
jgi:hypothetical protein